MKFSKLRLGVNSRDGKARFYPSEASMYGGQYRGDIGIDARNDSARVSLDQRISGVDFTPLLKDLTGKPQRFSGRGSANVKLAGSGRNSDDVMNTLDGNVDFAVADGALEGVDLWYEIRRARAVLKQQSVPERTGAARTPFDSMKGSGVMHQGVLDNNDLNIASQYLRVGGQGKLDLPKNTLDYRLTATVLKIPPEGSDATQMQDMVDAQIPIRITGALDDPKVRPDIEGYVKERAKKELKKQEEKIKDKLGDKLKDLLGR
jgi:AsmA protein